MSIENKRKKPYSTSIFLAVLLCTALTGILAAFSFAKGNNSAKSVITEYLEAEKDKDYVTSLSIEKVQISKEETDRIQEMYSGSELAEKNDWTVEYIAENMIAVYAKYNVDYDNTKVPYTEGEIEQFFYLTRPNKNANWTIWDASSPSDIPILENAI